MPERALDENEKLEMWHDEREIVSIHPFGDHQSVFNVGEQDVTKIQVYRERGHTDYIPYIAIWKSDSVIVRLPAVGMVIYYSQGDSGF